MKKKIKFGLLLTLWFIPQVSIPSPLLKYDVHKIYQNDEGMSLDDYLCNFDPKISYGFYVIKYNFSKFEKIINVGSVARNYLKNPFKKECWIVSAAALAVYGDLSDIPLLLKVSESTLDYHLSKDKIVGYADLYHPTQYEIKRLLSLSKMRLYSLRSAAILTRFGDDTSMEVQNLVKFLTKCSEQGYWSSKERSWRDHQTVAGLKSDRCLTFLSYIHTISAKESLEDIVNRFKIDESILDFQRKTRYYGIESYLTSSELKWPESIEK